MTAFHTARHGVSSHYTASCTVRGPRQGGGRTQGVSSHYTASCTVRGPRQGGWSYAGDGWPKFICQLGGGGGGEVKREVSIIQIPLTASIITSG